MLSETNNHLEVIDKLITGKLIYEHPVSTEAAPVYVLNRVLMKTDFTDELITLIGEEYISYEVTVKEILNLLYGFGKFNDSALKASEIAPAIYLKLHDKRIVAKTYESLGRKIRGITKKLEIRNILIRNNRKAYTINFDYIKSEESLF